MHLASLVLLSLFAQATLPTTVPESRLKAQALLREGTQHYQRGEYVDALELFQQAYAAFPSPKLLFNIGQASRELGRSVDAIEAFEEFLHRAVEHRWKSRPRLSVR